ncbi:MAG: transcription antitermination factor NusB [Myxococcales bacterium]|nr:transcription antitermination factor NusB [Myxococcales bacterium]
MGSRRRGREAALQVLYQMDASGASVGQALQYFWSSFATSKEGEEFATLLVRGCDTETDRINETIKGVSEHWRLERMSKVDRNILRLGTYELMCLPDVPRRVTLNEAVELAKRFGSEGSAGFVNGVLDKIASNLGKE